MLEKFLQDIGLSDKESQVYLRLLEVENDTIVNLAQKTKIKRTTLYPVLDQLEKKKLITLVKSGVKSKYQAAPPERLSTLIEEQKINLDEKSKVLKDILPQFKSVSSESGERPVIRYYEGREGILESIKDYYVSGAEGGTIHLIYPRDLIEKYFTDKEIKEARGSRLGHSIKSEAIYTYSKGDLPPSENSERVRLTDPNLKIKCDIGIYKDKVRINTLGNKLSAIYIKNEDFAETLRSIFKIAFDSLKQKK